MCKYNDGYLFVVCNILGEYVGRFEVQLFDKCNNLICTTTTAAHKSAKFEITIKDEYKIVVMPICTLYRLSPVAATRWVTLRPSCSDVQYFIFNKNDIPKTVMVNIKLTDYHYDNMPIKQGVLSLWPTRMT